MRLERTCLNEIVIYDPYTNDVTVKFAYHVPEKHMKPRKYFAGFLLGHIYYSHGGIESNGKILNEFLAIDLITLEWKSQPYERGAPQLLNPAVPLEDDLGFPEYCYGHRMVVIAYKRAICKLDELSKPDFGNEESFIRQEGVYMFGGVRGMTSNQAHLSSNVYVMTIGVKHSHPKWLLL